MSLDWVARQLDVAASAQRGLGLQVPRFNPRPAGVMQAGGAAKDVLAFLQSHPDRFFTFSQIRLGTGRTDKSIDWACIFLRTQGHVECYRDDGRNSRYLRYRAIPKEQQS